MLIAKSDKLDRIFSGPQIRQQGNNEHHSEIGHQLRCPICEKRVYYNETASDRSFDYFDHIDGNPDCFEADSVSNEHRITTEVTVKILHNRLREVTGIPVEIDVERWVGIREDFVIADVRVSEPLQIAAEIYYKSEPLALGRRLKTMFENGYKTYLIFRSDGVYDVDRVERYIRRVAPLSIGRFDPKTWELTLGDLFTDQQFELSQSNLDKLPDYIAR